jgi:predicted Zn-dependent peptidase
MTLRHVLWVIAALAWGTLRCGFATAQGALAPEPAVSSTAPVRSAVSKPQAGQPAVQTPASAQPSPTLRAAQLQAGGVQGLSFLRSVPFGPGSAELWQLANGLQIILAHDPAVAVAAVHTWVKTGSADEVPGKSGLAHLFEHLMFKSTVSRAAGTFDRELERFGASANAATWYDWTMYHEVVPAAQVPLAIELEADRLGALALTPPAVRSELEVVRNERRESVDDDPDGQLDEALWRAVFGDHPYGRPVIGAAADLEQLGIDDAVAFYRARYVPSQVAVVVAGGFDADAVLRAVARYHGALPQAASDPPRVQPKRPATVSTVVDLPIDASAARLAVAWRTVPLGHTDHAALALAAEALCGADSARWHRALVDEDRVASAKACSNCASPSAQDSAPKMPRAASAPCCRPSSLPSPSPMAKCAPPACACKPAACGSWPLSMAALKCSAVRGRRRGISRPVSSGGSAWRSSVRTMSTRCCGAGWCRRGG